MAFEDVMNIFLLLLVLLVFFFQRRRKSSHEKEKEEKDVFILPTPRVTPKIKEIVKKEILIEQTHQDLSDRYKEDPAYQIKKEKKIPLGRKLMKDKSSIKKGIILSEIFKRPYD